MALPNKVTVLLQNAPTDVLRPGDQGIGIVRRDPAAAFELFNGVGEPVKAVNEDSTHVAVLNEVKGETTK